MDEVPRGAIMSAQLLKPLALATVFAISCSWLVQSAQAQTVVPYGPYGYTPGAYDSSGRNYSGPSSGPGNSYSFDFGLPSYGRYGYTPGTYNNNYFRMGFAPSYSYTALNYAAPPVGFNTVPASRDNNRSVRIQVRVPADAKLFFDGAPTTQRGKVRTFESPPLDRAKEYEYELRATWQQDGRTVERTRRVPVRAGDRINVDLSTAQTGRSASR
jgi:uncharacterized protein (TIGR03000 family)